MVDRISSSTDRLEQAWIAARAARANASGGGDVLRDARALQGEAARLAEGAQRERIDAGSTGRDPNGDFSGRAGASTEAGGFGSTLMRGAAEIVSQVRGVEDLPTQVASGKVESIAELAAQVKSADLSFRFALEVRNKLIDAYREVMRMSV